MPSSGRSAIPSRSPSSDLSESILNFLAGMMPSPLHHLKASGFSEPNRKGDAVERKISDSEPVSLFRSERVHPEFSCRDDAFAAASPESLRVQRTEPQG